MTWPYSFDVGDLMRRADAIAAKHKADDDRMYRQLRAYPKKRKPQKAKLRKSAKNAPRCIFCGVEVAKGKKVCFLHEETQRNDDW